MIYIMIKINQIKILKLLKEKALRKRLQKDLINYNQTNKIVILHQTLNFQILSKRQASKKIFKILIIK